MRILYFAWLREMIGVAEEELAPPAEIRTVRDLIGWLKSRSAGHQTAFANERLVRCALDLEFAAPEMAIGNATEVAFFPPVTGG